MPIRRNAVAAIGITMLSIGCSGNDAAPASAPETVAARSTEPPAPATTPATTPAPSTPAPSTPAPVSVATRSASLCERTGTEVMGRVATTGLTEASGLAASRVHPGVLWSHNDGGGRPGVFAIGSDGRDLGFHELSLDGSPDAVDIEDMAIATGVEGDVLYLADIGDNGEGRSMISVFRFAEPDPSAPGPIDAVERFDFTYPDRPHNAETLLVDERNDRIVIVTKEQAAGADGRPDPLGATQAAFVFEGALDGSSSAPSPVTLTEAGVIDTIRLEQLADPSGLHPSSIFGFGGVVTGGDVAPDGSLVALRTYETVWVWERGDGASVAESLAGQACEVTAVSEFQGEAIAFVGDELVTIGEGEQQPINRLGR